MINIEAYPFLKDEYALLVNPLRSLGVLNVGTSTEPFFDKNRDWLCN